MKRYIYSLYTDIKRDIYIHIYTLKQRNAYTDMYTEMESYTIYTEIEKETYAIPH